MATPSVPPPPAPILEANPSLEHQIGLRPSFPESSSASSSQYLPALPHTVSIAFRHPGYDDQTNILFRLPAFDSGDSINWGIHHDTALTACSIIACNIAGFLSHTRLSRSVPRPSIPSPDSLLMGRTYYFYPVSWRDTGITEDNDLRYPVCPDFMDWQFPLTNFPPTWLDIEVSANQSILASHLLTDSSRVNHHHTSSGLHLPHPSFPWPCKSEMRAAASPASATARRPRIWFPEHRRNG